MTRGYRVVYPDFWESPRVLSMKPSERLLFLYLITAPDAHYCGIYHRPIPIMVFHTGLSEKEIRSALDTLSHTLCVRYDEGMHTVWVVNAARKNVISQQQIAGAVNYIRDNIRSRTILEEFSQTYPQILPSLDTLSHTLSYTLGGREGGTTGDRRLDIGYRIQDTEENTPPCPQRGKRTTILKPNKVEQEVWDSFTAQCKAKQKPATPLVMKKIEQEAQAAKISLNDALRWAADKGYARFEAEWYKNDMKAKPRKEGDHSDAIKFDDDDPYIKALERTVARPKT